MRLYTLSLAILALAGCGTTPRVNWPKVVQCSTGNAPAELFSTVQGVLLGDSTDQQAATPAASIGDRATSALEDLARKEGAQVVACLVDAAVHMFDQQPQESVMALSEPGSPETLPTLTPAQLAAARGRDFLQRVAKTRVEAP